MNSSNYQKAQEAPYSLIQTKIQTKPPKHLTKKTSEDYRSQKQFYLKKSEELRKAVNRHRAINSSNTFCISERQTASQPNSSREENITCQLRHLLITVMLYCHLSVLPPDVLCGLDRDLQCYIVYQPKTAKLVVLASE